MAAVPPAATAPTDRLSRPPMPSLHAHSTPNPHSLKFTVEGVNLLDEGHEAFNSADEAEGHDLGERLFSFAGVSNVFITPAFVTVTKTPETSWDDLLSRVERAIEDYAEDRDRA